MASLIASTVTFSTPCSAASLTAASARALRVARFLRSRSPGADVLVFATTCIVGKDAYPAKLFARGVTGAGTVPGPARNAVKGPTLTGRSLQLAAVAEGFEPSVSFPTLAFEASSFGRSDTLPRESLDHAGPWSEIRFPARAGSVPRGALSVPGRTPSAGPRRGSPGRRGSPRAGGSACGRVRRPRANPPPRPSRPAPRRPPG